METISSNEFLNSVLETEAWKELSERESLSMDILEKFARCIHWEEFSRSCPDNLISETSLHKFENRWDWKNLSNRDRIYNDWNLLEKFADKVNWGEVITNWNIEKPLEFFSRFQQYIPMSKLQESRLWDSLVEERAKKLYQEAIGIN